MANKSIFYDAIHVLRGCIFLRKRLKAPAPVAPPGLEGAGGVGMPAPAPRQRPRPPPENSGSPPPPPVHPVNSVNPV